MGFSGCSITFGLEISTAVKTRVSVCGYGSALAAGLGICEWLGYSRLDSHVAELD